MYLSMLLIDTGGNPDRPRPGREWLGNVYHVHQRLSMAFPSKETKTEDKLFLKPYDKDRFQPNRFLFRIDNTIQDNNSRAMIIVQSEVEPDWDYAFQNSPFLAAKPKSNEHLNLAFQTGEILRFRILINLSKKSNELVRKDVPKKHSGKEQGWRVPLTWKEDQDKDLFIKDWFTKKTEKLGFSIQEMEAINIGWKWGFKKSKGKDSTFVEHKMKFRSALIEGSLVINDPESMLNCIKTGIGSAKAFGFGLLSLVKV